jgi:enoyl-CoA hydratase/carnithine racemase
MRSGFDHLLLHVQTAKRTFYTAADMDYRNALDHMTEVLARLSATEDAKEGVKAFLEKRTPEWKER